VHFAKDRGVDLHAVPSGENSELVSNVARGYAAGEVCKDAARQRWWRAPDGSFPLTSSCLRRPVSMVEMDPGFRREYENGVRHLVSAETSVNSIAVVENCHSSSIG
jgi:hypothetical protein